MLPSPCSHSFDQGCFCLCRVFNKGTKRAKALGWLLRENIKRIEITYLVSPFQSRCCLTQVVVFYIYSNNLKQWMFWILLFFLITSISNENTSFEMFHPTVLPELVVYETKSLNRLIARIIRDLICLLN